MGAHCSHLFLPISNRLEYLYLGGNRLCTVPKELGSLKQLAALILCDNQLYELPNELTDLSNLHSLRLHGNNLQTLPPNLVNLTNLRELSLRNNPLVMRFVKEWSNQVPSLLELAAKAIKKHNTPYRPETIPSVLVDYLNGAQHCDNPNCNGVYFTSKYQSVKFVDFCGKYRVPLMQYLCSPVCAGSSDSDCLSSSEEEDHVAQVKMKKVLLG